MVLISVTVNETSYTTNMRFNRTHLLLLCSALVPACAIPGDAPWSDVHANVFAAGFTPTLNATSSNLVVPDTNGGVTPPDFRGSFKVNDDSSFTTYYGGRVGFAPFEISASQFNHSSNNSGVITDNGSFFNGVELNGNLNVDAAFDIDATKLMVGIDVLNTSIARVGILGGIDMFNFNRFAFTATEANGSIAVGGVQNVLINQEVPVPIVGVRGDVHLPGTNLRLGGEITGVSIDIDEIDASFIDVDVNVNYEIFTNAEAVVGYRKVALNIDGVIEDTTINMDLNMSGPYFGVSIYY